MKLTPEQLIEQSNKLFDAQYPMLSMWQMLADNFYPERADFTNIRNTGEELSDSLIDSYPILARRDMANSLSAMLRVDDWFSMDTSNSNPGYDGKAWLQWSTGRLRGLMDDRRSNFTRATKEADHDYVTFGQPVLSVEPNRTRDGLLYRCWHLRDCAWYDGDDGAVCGVHRKWKPKLHELMRIFGERVHPELKRLDGREPFREINIRHIFMPAEMYGDDKLSERFQYVSIFVDVDRKYIMEEVGLNYKMYVVPRFQTISGSPYAYSAATVVALPNSRLIQAMTHTLLEAGERYTRPPIIATEKVVRSDVDLAADGITWVSDKYDERLGASLRTLSQDRGGFPIGLELRDDVKGVIDSAFYLNKLSPPDLGREMTAYEFSERMKAYRRENLPLFAPIEAEYNGQLCETSFEISMQLGLLGSPYDIPDALRNADVKFRFKSPLSEQEEEKKRNTFLQVSEMLSSAVDFDQSATRDISISNALRDAVQGIGAPSSWIVPPETAAEVKQQDVMAAISAKAAEQGLMNE